MQRLLVSACTHRQARDWCPRAVHTPQTHCIVGRTAGQHGAIGRQLRLDVVGGVVGIARVRADGFKAARHVRVDGDVVLDGADLQTRTNFVEIYPSL